MNIFLFLSEQATKVASSPQSTYTKYSVFWQMFNIVLILLITIFLIYGFAYIAKKLKLDNKSNYKSNISILEYKNIGNHSNLIISKIGKKYILLGSTREKIEFLCELDENELNFKDEDEKSNYINFTDILNSKLKKNDKNKKDENGGF